MEVPAGWIVVEDVVFPSGVGEFEDGFDNPALCLGEFAGEAVEDDHFFDELGAELFSFVEEVEEGDEVRGGEEAV